MITGETTGTVRRTAGAPCRRQLRLGAAIAHNLLHAVDTLAGRPHTRARGATLRRQLIAVPARLARPARAPVLHLPSRWPWAPAWLQLWDHTIGHSPPAAA